MDPSPQSRPNVLRLMLGPSGVRSFVSNWEAVAQALVRRVHREAIGGVRDERTDKLLEEILAYPGVSDSVRRASREGPILPIIPVSFSKENRMFHYFSTVTTLGTPQDVTAQELRIECFFPADAETAVAAKELV